jgi:hypothetical protein
VAEDQERQNPEENETASDKAADTASKIVAAGKTSSWLS